MTERQAADAARRWEWAAAVRWFATRTFTEANARNWHAIADMIEAGDLTPWADQPEPAGPYVCQQPVGDENEWEPCANLRPCPWHDQPPAAPAEPSGAAPAAAGPHPDTPDRAAGVSGVLGRALLDADGSLWRHRGDGNGDLWAYPDNARPLTREEVEYAYGPVTEVLLVDPAAGWVLDVAREWRAARSQRGNGIDSDERYAYTSADLAAAVDALDADQPAEPSPAVVRCACGLPIVHATPDGYGADGCDDPDPDGQIARLNQAVADAEQRADAAEDRMVTASAERQWAVDGVCHRCGHGLSAAEPAPELDSGPGWDRGLTREAGRALRRAGEHALAAEVDRAVAELARVGRWRASEADERAELYRLDREARYAEGAYQRAAANQQRALLERDAARAELAEATSQARSRWQRMIELRQELAEVTADRNRLREAHKAVEWAEVLVHQECRAKLHTDWFVDSEHHHSCPWCEIDKLRAELATARRDAAVATYDEGARYIRHIFGDSIDPEVARCLDALADSTRAGRPVPGSPQPASSEGGQDGG